MQAKRESDAQAPKEKKDKIFIEFKKVRNT